MAATVTPPPAHAVKASFVATHQPVSHLSRLPKKRIVFSPWNVPTFADSTEGDSVDGEDLMVRRAAVEALGPYNGTIVVADPKTGRILTIVNQKLAYQSGLRALFNHQDCRGAGGTQRRNPEQQLHFRLTSAPFHGSDGGARAFQQRILCQRRSQAGIRQDRSLCAAVRSGRKAGLNIEGEQPGSIASEPPADGLGMMTSFGEGIYMTPLELAAHCLRGRERRNALLSSASALAGRNRSVRSAGEAAARYRAVASRHQAGHDGRGGVRHRRRAGFNATEPIFGKTGTCTDNRSPTHLGWFGSYNEIGRTQTGGGGSAHRWQTGKRPVASGVAGAVYKNLSQRELLRARLADRRAHRPGLHASLLRASVALN